MDEGTINELHVIAATEMQEAVDRHVAAGSFDLMTTSTRLDVAEQYIRAARAQADYVLSRQGDLK